MSRRYVAILARVIGPNLPFVRGSTAATQLSQSRHISKMQQFLRAAQRRLGHTKMVSTVRYLGDELEDALAIAEAIEIRKRRPSPGTAHCRQWTKEALADWIRSPNPIPLQKTVSITRGQ